MLGIKLTIRGLVKNWALKSRARKPLKLFTVTACGRTGADILIQIQPESGPGMLSIRFDQANIATICDTLRELQSQETLDSGIGHFPSSWMAAARSNEVDDWRLEDWIQTAMNAGPVVIYHDGSVWIGGPRGKWIDQDGIDDLMRRIDKGV